MHLRQAPIVLGPGMTPREQAADAVLRFVQALDQGDEDLIRSAFTKDGVLDISGLSRASGKSHPPQEGIDNIVNGVLAHVGSMCSSHHLSNFRVKLNETADHAEVHCYALAQHFRQGEGHDPSQRDYVLYGSTYWADVVKEGDGEGEMWRMRRIEVENIWSEGVRSVVD
ncbi:Hypothetical predicted protein [Lecanosticta acicola]|uniref:SnoaL-like domain-containing protein n=1 Tax=Lecanosticta acicola TaxID=111012 RepID=A0AAI9EBR5_9PEZI|nr:Hypothetical predicted protein [Lecanosticta acicola]